MEGRQSVLVGVGVVLHRKGLQPAVREGARHKTAGVESLGAGWKGGEVVIESGGWGTA
jgi:hypothetical protein